MEFSNTSGWSAAAVVVVMPAAEDCATWHGCGGVLRRSALDLDGAAVGDGDEGGGGDEEEEDAEARD